MYKVVDVIVVCCQVFFLYIVDVIGWVIVVKGQCWVVLLGICYIMEQIFYCGCLQEQFVIEMLIFEVDDWVQINQIIFDEFCFGIFSEVLWDYYLQMIVVLVEQGVEGVIFGCMEIGLLVFVEFSLLLVFDIVVIYVEDVVNFMFFVGLMLVV